MRPLAAWADDHWAAIGLALFFGAAMAISLTLMVGYNIVATRFDRLHRDTASAGPAVTATVAGRR